MMQRQYKTQIYFFFKKLMNGKHEETKQKHLSLFIIFTPAVWTSVMDTKLEPDQCIGWLVLLACCSYISIGHIWALSNNIKIFLFVNFPNALKENWGNSYIIQFVQQSDSLWNTLLESKQTMISSFSFLRYYSKKYCYIKYKYKYMNINWYINISDF